MTQQFSSNKPVVSGRRSNIGPFGVASLGISLAAAVVSLCGIGGLATLGGIVAMVAGFVCFFLNRETGSKRDLMIGIGGMLLGFVIFASSVYFDRTGMMGVETPEDPGAATAPERPAYRAPEEDPFASPDSLPQPTRPATKSRGDEGQ